VPEFESDGPQHHTGPDAEEPTEFGAALDSGISEVSDDRVPRFQEVTADLMISPGGWSGLEEGKEESRFSWKGTLPSVGETSERSECWKPFAVGLRLYGRFANPLLWDRSGNNGVIGFYHLPFREIPLDDTGACWIEGEEKDARGRPIQPMHRKDPLPELVAQPFHGDPLQVHRVPPGMHNHPGRLVYGDEELIAVENGQRSHAWRWLGCWNSEKLGGGQRSQKLRLRILVIVCQFPPMRYLNSFLVLVASISLFGAFPVKGEDRSPLEFLFGGKAEASSPGLDWMRRAAVPTGRKRVEIDLTAQVLRAWEGNRLVMKTHISSGRNRATPTGRFSAGWKNADHYSSLYNNAPMPWAVQVSGNIFIHGFTSVPNYPASHGCIRVPLTGMNPAKRFFTWVDPGTPISIAY